MECQITECGKRCYAKGLCRAHYMRLRFHGSALAGRAMNGKPAAWFEQHKDHIGVDCLMWPFSTDRYGYATVRYDGKMQYVSRLMCEHRHGPPPTPTHEAAHSCGRGHLACVHPQHLRWATRKENSSDCILHDTVAHGTRHGNAKLTEAIVATIRSRHGIKQCDLAAQYGVSASVVSMARRGKSWKHVC